MSRIQFRDTRIPQAKARRLHRLLSDRGVVATLGACQVSVARVYGYASWAELGLAVRFPTRPASDLSVAAETDAASILRDLLSVDRSLADDLCDAIRFHDVRSVERERDPFMDLVRRALDAEALEFIVRPDADGCVVRFPCFDAVADTRSDRAVYEAILASATRYARGGTEARFAVSHDGRRRDLTVHLPPTTAGTMIVVRTAIDAGMQLAELGMSEVERWKEALSEERGLVLICGRQGSGRTTTVGASLRFVRDRVFPRDPYRIDQPHECLIRGVTMHGPLTEVDEAFGSKIMGFLRKDGGASSIGLLPDAHSSRNALRSVLEGNVILAELDVPTVVDALDVLRDWGWAEEEIRESVLAVLAQALVDAPCGCDAAARWGCPRCAGDGTVGRTMVCELARPSRGEMEPPTILRDDALRWMRAGEATMRGIG